MKILGQQARTGLSLLFALLVIWVVSEIVMVREPVYPRLERFVFSAVSASTVKQKIQEEIDRFNNSDSPTAQTAAIVHIIECSQYLMYGKKLKVEHYYDYMRMITFPAQRRQLKDKQRYIEDTKRYLRRKRNLYLNFESYEISSPQFPAPGSGHELEAAIYVIRKNDKGGDFIRYNFRKHKDNRYYLLLDQSRGGIRFQLSGSGEHVN